MKLVQNNDDIEQLRGVMIQDKGARVFRTLKNVEMDILGEIRLIPEVRVSYVRNADRTISRCISIDEYQRISDEIHQALRKKRRVYANLG